MAENDDVAQTEDEAIRRGYIRTDALILEHVEPQFVARRRPCGGTVKEGDWCLITNPRPDNTQTVCYCRSGNCDNCYITQ
jgi:hypothetical protein